MPARPCRCVRFDGRRSATCAAPTVMRLQITQICVISAVCVFCAACQPTLELTFADHMGRFYARRYGFPPMLGRLIGYLSVCDPPDQSIGELAEALLASRSAIAGAVKRLEALRLLRRTRAAGERMDRVRIDLSSPAGDGHGRLGIRGDARDGARGPGGAARTRRSSGARCCWRCPPSRISWSSRCHGCSRSGTRAGRRWSPPVSFRREPGIGVSDERRARAGDQRVGPGQVLR